MISAKFGMQMTPPQLVLSMDYMHEWWIQHTTLGRKFGYFANPVKTWLVTKKEHLVTATALFASTGVQVTSVGRPYLSATIGTHKFVVSHIKERVSING